MNVDLYTFQSFHEMWRNTLEAGPDGRGKSRAGQGWDSKGGAALRSIHSDKAEVEMEHTNVFLEEIQGWKSWGRVFQSIEAFEPLIRLIAAREHLSWKDEDRIEHCTPGTHAVFRFGPYAIKIYAPKEAGGATDDSVREIWGMNTARKLGIPIPKVIAAGAVSDRYQFRYLVTEFLDCVPFDAFRSKLTEDEKYQFGGQLRTLTNRMNVPVEGGMAFDLREAALKNTRWHMFPQSFLSERCRLIETMPLLTSVFVHGDINPDNLVAVEGKGLVLIDFGDALVAPVEYETAGIAAELFRFEGTFMQGYFKGFTVDQIIEQCFAGLILHDFGADMIRNRFPEAESMRSLAALRSALAGTVQNAMQSS